jgi:hypothetical protein
VGATQAVSSVEANRMTKAGLNIFSIDMVLILER